MGGVGSMKTGGGVMTRIVKVLRWESGQVRGIVLGNEDVLVVSFTVPATLLESRIGSIAVAPSVDGSAGILEGVLSETEGSFVGYRSGSSVSQAPSVTLVVGRSKSFTARLEAGRTYYFNVRVSNPAPTQAASDVFIEFHPCWPARHG